MKKKLQIVTMTLMMGSFATGLMGCGNSPDGDGQKPYGGGDYGVMNKNYGPAGDGSSSRRMSNTNPNIDTSSRRMGNTNPNIDTSKRRMQNN